MKLNLLPTYVSKEKQGRFAFVLAGLIAIGALAAMIFMVRTSREALAAEKQRIADARPNAQRAVATSKQADQVITDNRGLILNINLADAMNKHNTVYPDLYDEVRKYIPDFFRISSMAAVPNGAESCTVTMTGYITSFQEYANLMIALLRIPGATAVSRSGFQLSDPGVPGLIPEDQTGRPVKPGDPRIPDDPHDRLDQQIANAQVTGFANAGGFGTSETPIVRGAMPTQSTITVAVVIAGKNLQTPNPRATLADSAALWGGAPTPGQPTPANRPTPAAPNVNRPAPNTNPGNNPANRNAPNRSQSEDE